MPRNVVGVYTLPEDLFVIETVIESSLVNSDLSDIAAALTDTINTAGTVPMTGAFRMVNSVALPGVVFGSSDIGIGAVSGGYGLIRVSDGAILGTFEDDLDVIWNGAHSWAGSVTFATQVAVMTALQITTSALYQGREVTSINSGMSALFHNAAPPTGWSIVVIDNFAMRLVSGTGGVSHAGSSFSTIFSQFASSIATPDNPAHTHGILADSPNIDTAVFFPAGVSSNTVSSGSSGGTSAHDHQFETRVFFVDIITAFKT